MRNLVVVILLLCSVSSFGQSTSEFWGSASFSKKVIKKTRLNLSLGYRIEEILANNSALFELGLVRKLPSKFKVEVSYRYSDKASVALKFKRVHRASFGLNKEFKLYKFRFDIRSKFQYEIRNQTSRKNTDLTSSTWRNRLKISKKIYKRTHLYLGSELFAFEDEEVLGRYRVLGGVKYGITKKIQINLRGVYENQFHGTQSSNIIAIGYAQRF